MAAHTRNDPWTAGWGIAKRLTNKQNMKMANKDSMMAQAEEKKDLANINDEKDIAKMALTDGKSDIAAKKVTIANKNVGRDKTVGAIAKAKIRYPKDTPATDKKLADTEQKLTASDGQTVTTGEKITSSEKTIQVFRASLKKKVEIPGKPRTRNQSSSRDDLSASKEIAKQLITIFPNFPSGFLLDKAKKCGTIENAINELLDHVVAQDFLIENTVKERVDKSLLLLNEGDMLKKVKLTEKRDFNPNDPLEIKFRLAKGHYLSVSGKFASPIESIDYVENRILMEIFERKKVEFKLEGKNTKEYFLFHGTNNWNIDSILKENFRVDLSGKHGQTHGRGIYFSEKTAIPEKFMKGTKRTLLLCRVLLGREFVGKAKDIPEGFDSKSVQPDNDKRANINIIKDVDQILPCFVLNLSPPEDEDDEEDAASANVHAIAKVTAWLAMQKFT